MSLAIRHINGNSHHDRVSIPLWGETNLIRYAL